MHRYLYHTLVEAVRDQPLNGTTLLTGVSKGRHALPHLHNDLSDADSAVFYVHKTLVRRISAQQGEMVTLPGIEPGLFGLKGRRVNQITP